MLSLNLVDLLPVFLLSKTFSILFNIMEYLKYEKYTSLILGLNIEVKTTIPSEQVYIQWFVMLWFCMQIL